MLINFSLVLSNVFFLAIVYIIEDTNIHMFPLVVFIFLGMFSLRSQFFLLPPSLSNTFQSPSPLQEHKIKLYSHQVSLLGHAQWTSPLLGQLLRLIHHLTLNYPYSPQPNPHSFTPLHLFSLHLHRYKLLTPHIQTHLLNQLTPWPLDPRSTSSNQKPSLMVLSVIQSLMLFFFMVLAPLKPLAIVSLLKIPSGVKL